MEKSLSVGMAAIVAALLFFSLFTEALAQVNFKPLERGDYTEVEERLIVMKGLEVGADYALRIRNNDNNVLPNDEKGTDTFQDLRLRLKTLFHRDVEVHLNLELGKGDFGNTNLRESEEDNRGRLANGGISGINAREAYLRYRFNPGSAILLGNHELSLGDRRGKVFQAIAPGFTFDCKMGTWCFPFGWSSLGEKSGDVIYHVALQYTAWDEVRAGFRHALEVEVFRIKYKETNIPLGKNLGPGRFNPDNPTNNVAFESVTGGIDSSQVLDGANPVYYDAQSQDYFGFRVNWEAGQFFFNFDVTSNQGSRNYHLYRDPSVGIVGALSTGELESSRSTKGVALETEIGMRFQKVLFGLRLMNATGDDFIDSSTTGGYLRPLNGYYEVTPGSYQGTRLYFNGADSDVESGAGLGHSINNTRLFGIYLDFEDREKMKLGYSLGIYQLKLNNPIEDSNGELQDNIGIEINNKITWFIHKAVRFQLEANAILTSGAFNPDDFTTPDASQDDIMQAIARLVYSF